MKRPPDGGSAQQPGPPPGSGPLAQQRGLAGWLPRRLAEAELSITVIGDVMLDRWWTGTIDRFCREAPAPVVEVNQRRSAPGGAANTAMNLAALGAQVSLAGLVGCDEAGAELLRQLQEAGVDTACVHQVPRLATTAKTRISSGGQVLLRLDDIPREIPAEGLEALAVSLPAALRGQDAVVLCDYGTGALAGPVRSTCWKYWRPAPAPCWPSSTPMSRMDGQR